MYYAHEVRHKNVMRPLYFLGSSVPSYRPWYGTAGNKLLHILLVLKGCSRTKIKISLMRL